MESPFLQASPIHRMLSQVDGQDDMLKFAIYNAATFLFVFLSVAIAISVYFVLNVFIRPLVWAVLVGAFLFPFKKRMAKYVKSSLQFLQAERVPLAFGLTFLPVKLVQGSLSTVEYVMETNNQLLLTTFVLFTLVYWMLIFQLHSYVFLVVHYLHSFLYNVLGLFSHPVAVWTTFFAFLVIVCIYREGDSNNFVWQGRWFWRNFSVFVWSLMLLHLVSLTGFVPLAIFVVVLVSFGIASDHGKEKSENVSPAIVYFVDNALNAFGIETRTIHHTHASVHDEQGSDELEETRTCSKSSENPNKGADNKKHTQADCNEKRTYRTSDPYFIALFWLFIVSRIWINIWTWPFLLTLFFLYVVKVVVKKFEMQERLYDILDNVKEYFADLYESKKEMLIPGPIQSSFSIMNKGDRKVIVLLSNKTDMIMSILIIICLLFSAVLGLALFAMQVQHESIYLITATGNVFNKTILNNKEFYNWTKLNESEFRDSVHNMIEQGYMMARQNIVVGISSFLTENTTSTRVQEELTNFFDQLYLTWTIENTNNTGKTLPAKNVDMNREFNNIFEIVRNNFGKIAEMLKTNVGMLYSIFESIWTILKGNVNFVVSIVTEIFSILLTSGTYVLNVIVSFVIFITTLFYLLSSSVDEYKPMEWLSSLSLGTKLGESVEKAIQDVFGAALKLATFYGVYTWLTHTLFGAQLVFIPAAIASALGVVPFMGTYWAAMPATLELWLIQDKGVQAIGLFVLHILPTYVVDTAIYSEIGGHPYLTGLAVAGGVMYTGMEGAFIGPFLLCTMIAAFEVYNHIMER